MGWRERQKSAKLPLIGRDLFLKLHEFGSVGTLFGTGSSTAKRIIALVGLVLAAAILIATTVVPAQGDSSVPGCVVLSPGAFLNISPFPTDGPATAHIVAPTMPLIRRLGPAGETLRIPGTREISRNCPGLGRDA